MSKIYLTEGQINAAIYKAINEAFGVGKDSQFISDDVDADDEVRDHWAEAEDAYLMRERLPKGWEKIERPDDSPIYRDPDFNEYTKDEYGNFVPIESDVDMDEMNMLRESIRGAVRQVINEIDMSQFGFNPGWGASDMFEKAKAGSKKSKESKGEKADERVHKGDMKKRASKRAIVLKWLKKNAVNNAEIMRLLWHPTPDKEDTKRGEFYKKRDGKINKDSGAQYSFNDAEINKLYAIKSNGV